MSDPEYDVAGLHPVLAEGATRRRQGPQYSDLSIDAARQLSQERQGAPTRLPALEFTKDFSIPGPAGDLPVRLYRPSSGHQGRPLLVYFHGGGFVAGSLDSHDSILRRLALIGDTSILSVEYRLAPEHQFPAAIDDGVAAVRYALANAAVLGGIPGVLFAGGDSAGGAIALAAAGVTEDVAGLLLFYPVTDLSRIGATESYRAYGDGRAGLSRDDMQWFAGHYAPDPDLRLDWRCSPLLADASVRFPKAFVATAEFDVLRSEGEVLCRQLSNRGVAVHHHAARGVNHGYLGAREEVPESGATLRAAAHWLNSLASVTGPPHSREGS